MVAESLSDADFSTDFNSRARARGGEARRSLSLQTKTLIAMGVLTCLLVAVNAYGWMLLRGGGEAMDRQALAIERRNEVAAARNAFEDARYWYVDLANSLSEEAETNAAEAMERLTAALEAVARFAPDEAATIRTQTAALGEAAMNALDSFIIEDGYEGQRHMDDVRARIAVVKPIFDDLTAARRSGFEDSTAALDRRIRFALVNSLTMVVVVLAVCFAAAALIQRMMIAPIRRTTRIMRRLADGDHGFDIRETDRPDEIGDMFRAIDVFRTNALERERLELESGAAEQAKNERARRVEDLIAGFRDSVAAVFSGVVEALDQVRASAADVSEEASGNNEQARKMADFASGASATVGDIASMNEQLDASIRAISEHVGRSDKIVAEAREASKRTETVIRELTEQTAEIDDIVAIISSVADQTSLLSLNATIEAARAGEAGRGFAVVASEVKNLASQTSSATEGISSQIADLQQASARAVDFVQRTVAVIEDVQDLANSIAGATKEQAAATREISTHLREAAQSTGSVSEGIRRVSDASVRTTQLAAGVSGTVDELGAQTRKLGDEIDAFLSSVRNV